MNGYINENEWINTGKMRNGPASQATKLMTAGY